MRKITCGYHGNAEQNQLNIDVMHTIIQCKRHKRSSSSSSQESHFRHFPLSIWCLKSSSIREADSFPTIPLTITVYSITASNHNQKNFKNSNTVRLKRRTVSSLLFFVMWRTMHNNGWWNPCLYCIAPSISPNKMTLHCLHLERPLGS